MTVGSTAEADAESFGALAREVKEERESNPYLVHLPHQSPTNTGARRCLVARWDRTVAVLKDGPM
jgi:hypothetical protein